MGKKPNPHEPTVNRIPGLAKAGAERPGTRPSWRARRGPVRDERNRNIVSQLIGVRERGAEFDANQYERAQSIGAKSQIDLKRKVDSSLKAFDGWHLPDVARVVGEVERNLYKTPMTASEIARRLSAEKGLAARLKLSGEPQAGFAIKPAFVWLVAELSGARKGRMITTRSVVSPALKRLVFRQFDKFGLGVSPKLLQRYPRLSRRIMSDLREDWLELSKAKPELYRREHKGKPVEDQPWRSVQSFVRIMWKLQNYKFNGALDRIAFEEALAGEPITRRSLIRNYKENKEFMERAQSTALWKELGQKNEIPDLHKALSRHEGFVQLLRYYGLGRERAGGRAEAASLRRRASEVLKWLEWTTLSYPEIGKRAGEGHEFVKLVNAAFQARAPAEISNRAREYILGLREQGLGARKISRLLEARNRKTLKEGITIGEKSVDNLLRKWRRKKEAAA